MENEVSQTSTVSIAEQQAAWINAEVGDLTDLQCDECLNRGYIAYAKDDTVHFTDCKCMTKRRSLSRLRRSGLEKLVEACTFENYLTPEQWQAEAKNTAKRFLGDYRGHWLIACGSVGSGKSHLCTAICAELIDSGNDVRYMMWMDESTRLKAMITEADDYDHFVNQLKKVDVLYIDDLFKTEQGKQPTSADVRLAFEILNHRYANRKTTIISTERTVKSLLEIDEAVGSRIYEMTKGYCISISGSKNWRLK